MPSNFTRKANRKRQTRLTFDPIDQSSSPATMSPANVRYALPGGKRQTPASSVQKFLDNSESDDVLSSAMKETTVQKGSKALPTPAKSSQSRAKAYISGASLLIISPLFHKFTPKNLCFVFYSISNLLF